MYYTYIIRCLDNSLYTGITNNIDRRMDEHFNQTKKCAKYTINHKPMQLEKVFVSKSRVLACKLEYQIKKLSKIEKETIINENSLHILDSKIDINEYKIIVQ